MKYHFLELIIDLDRDKKVLLNIVIGQNLSPSKFLSISTKLKEFFENWQNMTEDRFLVFSIWHSCSCNHGTKCFKRTKFYIFRIFQGHPSNFSVKWRYLSIHEIQFMWNCYQETTPNLVLPFFCNSNNAKPQVFHVNIFCVIGFSP